MKQLILSLSLCVAGVFSSLAATPDSIAYYNHTTDTATIAKILDATRRATIESPADRLVFVARQFIGLPYKAATLEGDTELLRINMSAFDCTTLVETAIALAQTAAVDTASIDEFATNLRNIRYRGGVVDGYASRLHYASDWIADNTERGNFAEVTAEFQKSARDVKTINFMSAHHRSYPALVGNDSLLNCIKDVEARYNNYRYYYIPAHITNTDAALKWFKNGDIVFFTTTTKGLDVSHMGIIVIERGMPFLIHASSKARMVVFEKQPIYNYILSNNVIKGVRIVRL